MYQMWNGDFEHIRKSIWYAKNYSTKQMVTPFSFSTAKRGVVSKFRIEELDLLTSGCNGEEEFRQQLLEYGDKYISEKSDFNIVITHTYRDSVREDEVIYNDRLLYMCALEKMNKSTKNSEYVLSNNEVLLDFIDYIKSLARNLETKDYLLYPFRLDKNIPDEQKYKLNQFAKDDLVDSDDNIIHKELKSLLEEYVIAYEACNSDINAYGEKLDSDYLLDDCEKKIDCYFRKNYHHLRDAIVWENEFVKTLIYQIENSDDIYQKAKLESILSIVHKQKQYRNGKISKEELCEFYEMRNQHIFDKIDDFNPESLEDDYIRNLYLEGGTDLIRTKIDIEDIYGSKYHDDMVKLGIVKGKVKNKSN